MQSTQRDPLILEIKKPGGENESSSRVEVISWNYEKFRSSLPELIETNVSFSSRPPFSWRELSLLFSLLPFAIPPFRPLTRWVGEDFFSTSLTCEVVITIFLSNFFLTCLKLFSRARARLFFFRRAKFFSNRHFEKKSSPRFRRFPFLNRFD